MKILADSVKSWDGSNQDRRILNSDAVRIPDELDLKGREVRAYSLSLSFLFTLFLF